MSEHNEFNLARAVSGRIRRLHHIQRYSPVPVVKSELVSTHSWQMAMIGMLIAYDLDLGDEEVCEVVTRCVVHDISEAISGDIIRTYKHGTPEMEAACAEADNRNTYEMTREFGRDVGDTVYLKWENAKDDTLYGDIVRLADALCVCTYCAEEVRMGNQHLTHVPDDIFYEVLWPMRNHPKLGKYIAQLFPHGSYTDIYDTDGAWVPTWKGPSRGT